MRADLFLFYVNKKLFVTLVQVEEILSVTVIVIGSYSLEIAAAE